MADPDPPTGGSVELPPLRDVIRRYGLGARKSLGQHFLLDLNLTRRIARATGDLTKGTVVEIGPGPGGLTRALLLEGTENLVAVERDERCLEALAELGGHFPRRLTVVAGDALETDLRSFGPAPRRIVANLPYNISTRLLVRWLHDIAASPGCYDSLTLMFQKEVADRLAAGPDTKAYGRLSVLAQWLCQVRPLFNLPAAAFTPPPKVSSTVVQLRPRAEPLCQAEIGRMERVTAAAFGQRRKMLRQAMKSLAGPAAGAETILAKAGVDGRLRAENLEIEHFCALARVLDTGASGQAD